MIEGRPSASESRALDGEDQQQLDVWVSQVEYLHRRHFARGEGYATDSGFAYDILLRRGWRMSDDWVHILIEPTVKDMLRQLRSVTACDCRDCMPLPTAT